MRLVDDKSACSVKRPLTGVDFMGGDFHNPNASCSGKVWKACSHSLADAEVETPTAFHHSAQGCEERATLGMYEGTTNPERVESAHIRLVEWLQPFQGWLCFSNPRVGAPASRQLWAE